MWDDYLMLKLAQKQKDRYWHFLIRNITVCPWGIVIKWGPGAVRLTVRVQPSVLWDNLVPRVRQKEEGGTEKKEEEMKGWEPSQHWVKEKLVHYARSPSFPQNLTGIHFQALVSYTERLWQTQWSKINKHSKPTGRYFIDTSFSCFLTL